MEMKEKKTQHLTPAEWSQVGPKRTLKNAQRGTQKWDHRNTHGGASRES
jgi:hypothetical protein